MQIPQAVTIREVGPRDGLQLEQPLAIEQKLQLIGALARTGVSRIEATAFVSPRAMPTMADADRIAGALAAWPTVQWSALVASPGGARRAVAAGMRRLEYVVSAADGHSLANVRRTTGEATEATAEVARIVHDAGGQPTRRSEASAAVPSRPAPRATSPPRSWSTCWPTPASRPASTWTAAWTPRGWRRNWSVTRWTATWSGPAGDHGRLPARPADPGGQGRSISVSSAIQIGELAWSMKLRSSAIRSAAAARPAGLSRAASKSSRLSNQTSATPS
jgi:HMGL-like